MKHLAINISVFLGSLLFLYLASQVVIAFTSPTLAPPNGNVAPPLQEGINPNVLDVTGTLTGERDITNINALMGSDAGSSDLFVKSNPLETGPIYYGANLHRFYTGGTEKLTILANGNVGIGTADPQSLLHLKKAVGAIRIRLDSGVGDALGLEMIEAGVSKGAIQRDGTKIDFYAGGLGLGDRKMSILDNGNVGIGTVSPGEKFEVNGGVRLNTSAAKPSCDSTKRGTLWSTQGGSGVSDKLEICAKNVADSYKWTDIILTPPLVFQGILYGITDGNPANLYIINAGTDNVTNIGPLSVAGGDFGLAFNFRNGLFYAVNGNQPLPELLSVNPFTGSSQVVGPLGPGAGGDPGLAYDQNTDTLWIVSDMSPDPVPLHRVDIATGAATKIGDLDTVSWGNSNMGAAFDPAMNTLYAVSSSKGLFKVNTATGAATNVCTLWSPQSVGLAFHQTEHLLYAVDSIEKKVYKINPAAQVAGSPCTATIFANFPSLGNLEGIDFR